MPTAAASSTFPIGGELEVNRLGFGAMRLCGPGITGPPADRENALAVLRRAVELDVDHIDTADAYGPYVDEELIAEALHPYPDGLMIATKGGLVRDGSSGDWPQDGRPEHLREACEGSLRRLRVERIDLYYLHRPDPDVPYEESIGALRDLRDEGKINHVAVSNASLELLEVARGIVDIAAVQNQYSLTDRRSQDVLDVCERDGIGFVPWAPLDAGALRPGGAVARIAEGHGATPMQVAIAWLLHASPAMLPIPGTSSLGHLEENVAAAELELSAGELAELDALGAQL
jgi:aryl-alcohol dehydrogenase-like predicted oxidoreductase